MNSLTEKEPKANFLTEETIVKMYPYQIEKIERDIRDFFILNEKSKKHPWKTCPKCHQTAKEFNDGGYTYDKKGNRKKHLLKCSECHHRFTEDHGELTWYSHKDESIWNKMIEDTIKGRSIKETAADINTHETSVFRMRHKVLGFMEEIVQEEKVSNVLEIDEKYLPECHKGLEHVLITGKTIYQQAKTRKHVSPGLGDDKSCIVSVVERNGSSYLRTYNMGKPKGEEIAEVRDHVGDRSYIFSDGSSVYQSIFKDKGCLIKELKSDEPYDSVNHLNNVNSLHSRICEWNRAYRGVNTIYINRYNSLYALRQKYTGYDIQEIVIHIRSKLKEKVHYFFQRNLRNESKIFNDPIVMKAREGLIGNIVISRMIKYEGYNRIYVDEITDSLQNDPELCLC